ncbi:hypothetical protein AB0N88_28555, partial [Streptomyces sp. NPDC093516]
MGRGVLGLERSGGPDPGRSEGGRSAAAGAWRGARRAQLAGAARELTPGHAVARLALTRSGSATVVRAPLQAEIKDVHAARVLARVMNERDLAGRV